LRLIRWIDDQRRLGWWLSALVLVIAAGDAWASRHHVNPDGISYLDLGNVVFAHGIRAGANIAWSPAYTWVVGAALDLVGPSRPHELLVVMAVNLVIVAVVLVAFAWWLRELFALLRHRRIELEISERVLQVLAYAVLAWAVLTEVTAGAVTPDMLLVAIGFAATAMLMRIARLGGSPATWLGLGVLLGLGYLVKAGFVVPALVACAACAALTTGAGIRRFGAVALTFAAGVCVAAPFVAVLSSKEGRLELGDYGSLNYAWDVDGVMQFLNWTGGNGEFGRPVHPTLIASAPPTFAYGSPIGGSIPVWYDPAYWYAGVHPRPVVGGQVRAFASSVKITLRAVVVGPLILLLVPLLLLWRGRGRGPGGEPPDRAPWSRRALRAVTDHAYLALAIAGVLTYLPLTVVTRYIAAYIAILAITAFALVCGRLGRPDLPRRVVDRVALATVLVATVMFVYAALRPADHVASQLTGGDAPGTSDLRVARALTRAGLGAGAGVVFVGESDGVVSAYWARLDGDRVVGNIQDLNGAFWRLPSAMQSGRLAMLQARSGARAVVSDEPQARLAAGWVPIAGTGDSYRLLGAS
jgi:hypothetical protein